MHGCHNTQEAWLKDVNKENGDRIASQYKDNQSWKTNNSYPS